jgi:hypothetical protein
MRDGKHKNFLEACDAYDAACAEGDLDEARKQRKVIEELRAAACDSCRAKKHLSPAEQACKDFYREARAAACAANDGCAKEDCPVRGPEACCVLQADHGTNPKKRDANGNTVDLSNYIAWPRFGGVSAMREELKQIDKWICGFCHKLEKTSKSGNRCGDPAAMPVGKARGTPEEKKQYHTRHSALVRYPKQQYVDARKLAIGACAHCKREVTPETVQAFDFNHLDPSKKSKGGLFGQQGGVGGLVGSHAKGASLEKVKGLLDAEMDMCNLLCTNCHYIHTYKKMRIK